MGRPSLFVSRESAAQRWSNVLVKPQAVATFWNRVLAWAHVAWSSVLSAVVPSVWFAHSVFSVVRS